MSTQELKQIVDQTTPEERLFLASYLQFLSDSEDQEYCAELARRIDHGTYRTLDELKASHLALEAEGR